ncbi:hypothetical protein F7725_015741 [Dissostichus mawsoni]|uniref:Uncharacterized protein n=1 Tax=Dissostichus mawsoni TaxID=36200 RepID=A0A7J5YIF0_DISMA|nr:hypothetical protein F7725_015741 [Dissostichus mawsoni]
MSLGMSYKPNVHQHIPGTSGNQVGSLQSPSAANLATLQSYRPLLSDFGPPSGILTGLQWQPSASEQICRAAGHHRRAWEGDQAHICRKQECNGETEKRPL